MTEIAQSMKIWTVKGVGNPRDVLHFTDTATTPAPKAGEILIRVSYVAVNPADYKLMKMWIPFRSNYTPGCDFVGRVVQIGHAVPSSGSSLRIGMTVAGCVPLMATIRGVGVLAEYVALPAYAAVEVAEGLEETVAAGLFGVAGQTSVAVLDAAKLQDGDKVLINGASGGVGCVLVQALSGRGVRITGICSSRNAALVQRLGANEVVDYTAHKDLYRYLASLCSEPSKGSFDAVIDCVGDMDLCYQSPAYLNADGKCISIEGSLLRQLKANCLPLMLGGSPRRYRSIMMRPSPAGAKEISGWWEKGWIKEIPVDSVFDMSKAVEALEKQATGRAAGKIFIKVE